METFIYLGISCGHTCSSIRPRSIDCSIDESVIRKMNPLIFAVTSGKFKSVFLHVF